MSNAPLHRDERTRRVAAVLGPTNTGKTYFAIERMLAYPTGAIGLPLRLLAREVYTRVVERVGADAVALITGEEKIKPKQPRYWICTLEAMPRDLNVAFVAIDEVQLAADLDRGHTFTDRLLNRRGTEDTLLIGAETMRPLVEHLLPGATVITRPRLSTLSFAGQRKLARLPRRSAIVAFSAEDVYAIAEWMRRQRGGAAVVLGALSPRTRNAQVQMYQDGEVDFIVATDAIGMGLNLDVDHVAFAGDRKFDGWHFRRLFPAEIGQIAGRAGRHLRDGTFGTTGRCSPFEPELIEAVEDHRFEPLTILQWRNSALDFSTIDSLRASLDVMPSETGLTRAPLADDELVLDLMARDADVRRQAVTRADVQRLWDACQIPDYRKLSPAAHADLVLTLFGFVVRAGRVPADWFATQIAGLDRTDGEIDTLSARLAQVRTWNYVANRPDWLGDPEHWQGLTRQVEDRLSDALHERLAQRFVDRRTSLLMRRLRENVTMTAEVTPSGDVLVEGQHVGSLHGFRFAPDPHADGEAARTLNAAASSALASEIEGRAERVHAAVDDAFVLTHDGTIRWLGEAIGRTVAGEKMLSPGARVIADEQLTGPALEKVQTRLDLWLGQHIKKLLGPLLVLEAGEGLDGLARGIGFQVAETLGVLDRSRVANDLKSLPQDGRASLRKLGIRFGAYHLYLPALLKPAPRALAAQLWALKNAGLQAVAGGDEVPHLAASGRTSFPADKEVPKGFYLAAGFRVSGERAVRVDMLERLADLIRPAIAYRPGVTPGEPPVGTADRDGFVVTSAMTSLVGCSGEAFGSILRSLNYVVDRRAGPPITVPLLPAAPTTPLNPVVVSDEAAPKVAASDAAATEEGAPDEVSAEPGEPVVEPQDEAASEAEPPVEASAAAEEGGPPAAEPSVVAQEPAAEKPVAEQPVVSDPPVEAASDTAEPAAGAEPPSEAADANAEPVPVEIPLIEVWRPHRQHHHAPRRPDRSDQAARPPRRFSRPQAAAAAPPAEGAPAATAAEASIPAAGAERPRSFRDRNRGPGGGRPEGSPGGGPRPPGDRPFRGGGDRRDGKPGDDRPRGPRPGRDDRRPERPPPAAMTTERPRRDRAPDPDSPFAKLAALKAELESRGKKD